MAYSRTTWVNGVAPAIDATNLNNIEQGILDVETTAGAAVAKALVDAKGDLLVGSAADTVARLAVGATNGMALVVDSAQSVGAKWVLPPGYEYAYTERTSNLTTTQTTPSSADTLLTAAAVTFDGATVAIVEAFVPEVFNSAATNYNNLALFEDGTLKAILGRVNSALTTQGTSLTGAIRFTPASGSRTYSARIYVSGGTGTFSAGSGAGGGFVPAFIRITKA